MAVLSGNVRPLLVARAGVGRAKQVRCGWAPKYTKAGGFYIWKMKQGPPNLGPSTVWTAKHPAASAR